jgi:hypothetical protein
VDAVNAVLLKEENGHGSQKTGVLDVFADVKGLVVLILARSFPFSESGREMIGDAACSFFLSNGG